MKKILFVVNTLGRAGAETALLELLRRLDVPAYEVSLYVVMAQGEMLGELPGHVNLLNRRYSCQSVLSGKGKHNMTQRVLGCFFRNGEMSRKLRYLFSVYGDMRRRGNVQKDKLLWRIVSDGGERFGQSYDLAVAWLEGASAYYVADHVKASKKAAFIHIDYESAGYTRNMDQACFAAYDRIFAVSEEVKKHFLAVYPEYGGKMGIFHNLVDWEGIRKKAGEPGGFSDGYEGFRLLTVGRLVYQKAYDVAIDAMKLLRDAGCKVRWYVLGEGDQRKILEKKIASLGLQQDFLLLGAVANPYPYYTQTDLYIHATRFEGKSIAIQEAQALGCAVIVSDCNGNREQVTDGEDGVLCELTPQGIADCIRGLMEDQEKRRMLAQTAEGKYKKQEQHMGLLLELLEEGVGEDS